MISVMAKIKEKKLDKSLPEEQLSLEMGPGATFKNSRLSQHFTTATVSESLRISERYLVAIEEQDASVLPEQVYTLGFVRTYAIFLGLDADHLVNDFKQTMNLTKGQVYDFPIPDQTSSVPKVSLILGSIVVMGLIYALWVVFNTNNSIEEIVTQEAPIETAPVKTPVIDAIVTPEATTPIPVIAESAPAPAPTTEQQTVSVADFYIVPGQLLNVKAKELSWVEIKDSKGNTLLNATLKAGETKSVMVTNEVTISTGNAGGITLCTGNLCTKELGTSGQVLHSLAVPFKVLS